MQIQKWVGGAFIALIAGFAIVALFGDLTLWNLMWITIVVGVIAAWILALQDIWRRADLKPLRATVWTLGILIFPVLGTLVYYFARPPAQDIRYRNETLS